MEDRRATTLHGRLFFYRTQLSQVRMSEISTEELLKTIADFLEMGHAENIVALFKKDTAMYSLSGDLLRDERFAVRLGTAVLFEELTQLRPQEVKLALPSLLPLLKEPDPFLRGEAANIIGIINAEEGLAHLKDLQDDPNPQVAEIVTDILSRA